MRGIKTKLALMNFLEFAVWGSYLVCLGNYLITAELGKDIALFYSVQVFAFSIALSKVVET